MSNFVSFNERSEEYIIDLDSVICIYTDGCVLYVSLANEEAIRIECCHGERVRERVRWIFSRMVWYDDDDDGDEAIETETYRKVVSLDVFNGGMLLHYDKGISTWVHIPEERRQEMIDKLMKKGE